MICEKFLAQLPGAGLTHEKYIEPVTPAKAGVQRNKRLEEAPYNLLYINKYSVASQRIFFAGHLPSQV